MGGVVGHYLSNPFFMVKTHLQSQAAKSIAVGYQHQHKGSFYALRDILKEYGVRRIIASFLAFEMNKLIDNINNKILIVGCS